MEFTPALCALLVMTANDKAPETLLMKVTEGLAALSPHLQSWVQKHLIEPRQVCLATDSDGTSFRNLWLVTNQLGTNDSSYRIVYDDEADAFGLECTLESGVEWYMGNYGSFSETVENM